MDNEIFSKNKRQRWVIKIGSSLLTNKVGGIDKLYMAGWVRQMATLQEWGVDIVLVSSGAVAAGMGELKLSKRPTALPDLQATASIGQMKLAQTYKSEFNKHGVRIGQILLTHDDILNSKRYINAQNTLTTLLEWKVIPVINENDSVANEELCFSDNDTLAAMVVGLVHANKLILLTDQNGIYDEDPRKNANAKFIPQANPHCELVAKMAGGSGSLGRGGMVTKVGAARIANGFNAPTIIANGRASNVLQKIYHGNSIGSYLTGDIPLSLKNTPYSQDGTSLRFSSPAKPG